MPEAEGGNGCFKYHQSHGRSGLPYNSCQESVFSQQTFTIDGGYIDGASKLLFRTDRQSASSGSRQQYRNLESHVLFSVWQIRGAAACIQSLRGCALYSVQDTQYHPWEVDEVLSLGNYCVPGKIARCRFVKVCACLADLCLYLWYRRPAHRCRVAHIFRTLLTFKRLSYF